MLRDLTWPHLIGGVTGAVGLAQLLFGLSAVISLAPAVPQHLSVLDLSVSIAATAIAGLIIVLSVFLYRGHEWARRVLVAIAICAALVCIVRAGRFFFLPVSGRVDVQLALYMYVTDVARLILYAVVPVGLVFALCHRDVVNAFKTAKEPPVSIKA